MPRQPRSAATLTDDGWIRTGDIGHVDADGYLFVVDRLKVLIKVKGLQVAPAELEDVMIFVAGRTASYKHLRRLLRGLADRV